MREVIPGEGKEISLTGKGSFLKLLKGQGRSIIILPVTLFRLIK